MAAESHDTTFRHQPLPGHDYIRLLEVLDINDGGIRCRLTSWAVEKIPEYNAISYVWGDAYPRASITINDRRLEVTQNCAYALKQTLWFRGGRYCWVDAICIDQSNNAEKSDQVARMGEIYADARRVLACVGPHTSEDDSEFLLRIMRQHSRFLCHISSATTFEIRERWMWLRMVLAHRKPTLLRAFSAVKALTERKYFQRLWVLQELFRGRDVVLCCGTDHVSFGTLGGLCWMARMEDEVEGFPVDGTRIQTIVRLLDSKSQRRFRFCAILNQQLGRGSLIHAAQANLSERSHISEVFYESRHLICQDPRDKVYGILTMVDWNGQDPIQPDYSKGRLGVFIELIAASYRKLEYGFSKDRIIDLMGCASESLQLEGSSLQELGCRGPNAMVADMIELQQPTWAKMTYHNTEGGSGGRTELFLSFCNSGWQLNEVPASSVAGLSYVHSHVPGLFRGLYPSVLMVVTDQGDAWFIVMNGCLEAGQWIVKLRALPGQTSMGSLVYGLLMVRDVDGELRVKDCILIYEPQACALGYEVGPGDPCRQKRIEVTVVTKSGSCQDGEDKLKDIPLYSVALPPFHGIRRLNEEFI